MAPRKTAKKKARPVNRAASNRAAPRRKKKDSPKSSYPSWVMPLVVGGCTLIAGIAIGWGYGIVSGTLGERSSQVARTDAAPKTGGIPRVILPPVPSPSLVPREERTEPTTPVVVVPSKRAADTTPVEVIASPRLQAGTASPDPMKTAPAVVSTPTPTPAPAPPVFEPVDAAPSAPPSRPAVPSKMVSEPLASSEPQLAAVTAPPPRSTYSRPPDGTSPAWIRYAVPEPAIASGQPMIAIVIDDMGVDRKRSERMIALPAPLTMAFLPYADNLPAMTAAARARGHELMVHVPMEPLNMKGNYPGPNALMAGKSAETIREQLRRNLSEFDSYVGINNHMGSRFTMDSAGMAAVAEELKGRGLLFLDSVTSAKTVAGRMTRQAGVPTISRDVFLDNENTISAVMAQLRQVEQKARKAGYVIAIGHPRDGTIEALRQWIPTVQEKGFVLVPITTMTRRLGQSG